MHNSQDGSPEALEGAGVGWDGSNALTGGTADSIPNPVLLKTGCVGCHTSTTSETIIDMYGSGDVVPIVFNTAPPAQPLAGGNFYWVRQGGDDRMGHNVYGISAQDTNLNRAPGDIQATNCGGAAASVCHTTLAVQDNPIWPGKQGCQSCHFEVFHHVQDDAASQNVGYRFLWGHGSGRNVWGAEDSDWEQTTSVSDHNYYYGTKDLTYTNPGDSLSTFHTVTALCSGCHNAFHGPARNGTRGMGEGDPWIRHPADAELPETGEYTGYDPTINYSVEAPVAWDNIATIETRTPVRSEAVVMCLSCHRAHGSPQPDMLRWDYATMEAGGGGSGGCFTCHTNKN